MVGAVARSSSHTGWQEAFVLERVEDAASSRWCPEPCLHVRRVISPAPQSLPYVEVPRRTQNPARVGKLRAS